MIIAEEGVLQEGEKKDKDMKKLKRMKIWLFLLALCLLVPCSTVYAQEISVTSTEAQSGFQAGTLKKTSDGKYYYLVNGKKQRSVWKVLTVSGVKQKYYFNSKGYAVTYSNVIDGKLYVFNTKGQLQRSTNGSWQTVNVGKNTYYINKYGRANTGWLIIGGRLYCTDSKGRFLKNKTYEGVVFSSTGKSKINTASKLKIKTIQIVNSITTPSMSSDQKIRAVWNYVANSGRFYYYAPDDPNIYQAGWQRGCAYLMLTTGRGNCYGFACTFAALVRAAGVNPYLVCGRIPGSRDGAADGLTRHCWVKIKGYTYDPEGQFAGWGPGIYHYSDYPMRHTIQKTLSFAKG